MNLKLKNLLNITFLIGCLGLAGANSGEAQTGHKASLSFAIIGDGGEWNAPAQQVEQSILSSGVKNLILPGDNLYNLHQTYANVWDHWSSAGLKFSVVAIGNHNKTYKDEIEFFRMPGEYYARTDGTVRFIVLNSDNVTTATEQGRWLEKQLLQATEPFVFLVYHHPSFKIGSHAWQDKRDFQMQVRPLIARYQQKITGILVGHDHIASLVQLNQVPLIVSGAVFESLTATPVNYVEDGVSVKTRWLFNGGYYWTRMDIDPNTQEVWINFVSATLNRVTCSMRIAPRPLLARSNCLEPAAQSVEN